jgi:hypothetical protein
MLYSHLPFEVVAHGLPLLLKEAGKDVAAQMQGWSITDGKW